MNSKANRKLGFDWLCCRLDVLIADDGHGQSIPSVDDCAVSVVADAESSQTLEPSERAFDDPTDFAQAAAMVFALLANMGLDSQPTKQNASRLATAAEFRHATTSHRLVPLKEDDAL